MRKQPNRFYVGPLREAPTASIAAVCIFCKQTFMTRGQRCECWKKTKLHACKFKVGPFTFDSLGECDRWQKLIWASQQGIIFNLKFKPKFEFLVLGAPICNYTGDYSYTFNGFDVIEDWKGHLTPVFKLKAKLFKILYPLFKLEIVNAKENR